MVVNWANLIYMEEDSDMMVLILLIIANSCGLLSILILIWRRLKHEIAIVNIDDMQRLENNEKQDKAYENDNEQGVETNERDVDVQHPQKITFWKIKLFSMYLFGFCYLFHCGLYAWKHNSESSTNHRLGLSYNIITIFYVFSLFIYFAMFHAKPYKNDRIENVCTLLILVSNVSIWLDTLFSESDFLFERNIENLNESRAEKLTDLYPKAEEVIEKTDPYLSPAMIEFSLITIDMLFSKEDTYKRTGKNQTTKRQPIGFIKACGQYFIFLLSFAFFAFTFSVVLLPFNTELNENTFITYVSIELVLKMFSLGLISICIIPVYKKLTYHLNVGAFILIITCFGNVLYHMFYCFALYSNADENDAISWVNNVVSIAVAGLQTYFILGIHSCIVFDKSKMVNISWKEKNRMYYLCSLLSMINFGLWICDSLGEERFPVFSKILFEAYGQSVWSVINKLILPLTIFFRFHTGLDFLKLYWERSKHMDMVEKETERLA